MDKKPIFLSCGFGVQSSTLLAMACVGDLPKPDGVIFCDTGAESQETYNFFEKMLHFARFHGVNVQRIQTVNLLNHGITKPEKVLLPPLHFRKEKRRCRLRHRCSHLLKVRPFVAAVRERLGYKPRQWVKEQVIQWVGISWEERHRCQRDRLPWLHNVYPLVERGITRNDCFAYMNRVKAPIPPRSSCIICPLRPNSDWIRIKTHQPDQWERACRYDEAIRDQGQGRYHRLYVHPSCVPLRFADISRVRGQKHGRTK